jgi:hypothetical protein
MPRITKRIRPPSAAPAPMPMAAEVLSPLLGEGVGEAVGLVQLVLKDIDGVPVVSPDAELV